MRVHGNDLYKDIKNMFDLLKGMILNRGYLSKFRATERFLNLTKLKQSPVLTLFFGNWISQKGYEIIFLLYIDNEKFVEIIPILKTSKMLAYYLSFVTCRQTGRQTGSKIDRQTDRQIETETKRHIKRRTEKQRDKRTDRKTNRLIHRQRGSGKRRRGKKLKRITETQ